MRTKLIVVNIPFVIYKLYEDLYVMPKPFIVLPLFTSLSLERRFEFTVPS